MTKLVIPAKVSNPKGRAQVNFSVGTEVFRRMQSFKDVNWSAFVRQQIELALDQLESDVASVDKKPRK